MIKDVCMQPPLARRSRKFPNFCPRFPCSLTPRRAWERSSKPAYPDQGVDLKTRTSSRRPPKLLATWLPGPCSKPASASAWLEVELDASRYDGWRPGNGGQCDHSCAPPLVLCTPWVRLSSLLLFQLPLSGCRGEQTSYMHEDTWAALRALEFRAEVDFTWTRSEGQRPTTRSQTFRNQARPRQATPRQTA